VVYSVLGVKTWLPPAQKFELLKNIPQEATKLWQLDNLHLSRSGIILQKGNAVSSKTIKTGSSFSRAVKLLEPPAGKFVEVLVALKNTGITKATLTFSWDTPPYLDIPLRLPDGALHHPADFLFPDLDGGTIRDLERLQKEGLTAVSSFELLKDGWIGVELEPDEHTWVLLLYDVEVKAKAGMLIVGRLGALELAW
jgi:hypothetical protein